MSRQRKNWRAYSGQRWQLWFTAQFQRLGVSAKKLAATASDVPIHDSAAPGRSSRRLIGAQKIATWMRDGTPTPTAETAYRIGEGLRRCNPASATASGPLAMHAAGHGRETLQFLRALAYTRAGARNAVVLYCLLPQVNSALDYVKSSYPFGAFCRDQQANENVMRGAQIIDEEDACQLHAEAQRQQKVSWRSHNDGGDSDEKFRRYQAAFELMSHFRDARPPRPTNLNQADALAGFLIGAIDEYYKHIFPFEYAMCESWWIMQRWAHNAHPYVFEKLRTSLERYFMNLDQIDPHIEGLELVPIDEIFSTSFPGDFRP